MLIQRLASAAVGIPLIILVVWQGGWLLAAVVAAAVAVAVIEIGAARGATRAPMTLVAAGLAAVLPLAAHEGLDYLVGATAGAVMLISAAFVVSSRDPEKDVAGWLWGIGSIVYFGLLAAHFVLLRELGALQRELLRSIEQGSLNPAPEAVLAFLKTFIERYDGFEWLLFALLVVWATDTGAYAVGRLIGRHKLAPAISPGKTIEGGVGSAVTGFAAVFALNAVLGLDLAIEHCIALGLLLPPVILIGDLAESAIKRSLGVKDSSGLVPGHGGVADRLDSLLFAVPVVYWYLQWIIL